MLARGRVAIRHCWTPVGCRPTAQHVAMRTKSYDRLCCLRHKTSPVCAPMIINCKVRQESKEP